MPQQNEGKVRRGQVIWFNEKKGFGFLKPECPDCRRPIDKNRCRCEACGFVVVDVFVHYSAIVPAAEGALRNLTSGQLVEFEVLEGKDKKPMAHQVRVVKFDDPRWEESAAAVKL